MSGSSPDRPPPLSEEEGAEAAEELESYPEDPEGYEGDIAEVLAMLTIVTGAGPGYQGHLNPEAADSMAGIFEAYIDAFADDEILGADDEIDPSVDTGHNGSGDYAVSLGDRRGFIQLIAGSSDAFERVVDASTQYTNESLESYMNTHDGYPDVNHAVRSGLCGMR